MRRLRRIAGYGRSSVQDHQTKGDQPFQALVARQIEVQPPCRRRTRTSRRLRGRKVLAFSDSRQVAARLAPNLQTYSMRDVIRPLILRGWTDLAAQPGVGAQLSLDRLYLAVMVGAKQLKVRLRPELRQAESLHVLRDVGKAIEMGALSGKRGRHAGTSHADGPAATGAAPRHVRDPDRQVLRPGLARALRRYARRRA